MKGILTALCCCLALLTGCENNPEVVQSETVPTAQAVQTVKTVPFQGCRTCHAGIRFDANHEFACVRCHGGNENGTDEQSAHQGLIAKPAHPDFMKRSCGECHGEKVEECGSSLHFTLRNKINQIREHFGSEQNLASLTQVAPSIQPETPLELVDDMLRRRCLRCHVFTSGDTYAYTQRGTGCAACHMGFSNGSLQSHELIGLPGDFQCLGCHYANFVGADYYGRYEHDFNAEYRTPFVTDDEYIRPYGVEYHELAPDIHQQRGLACVDCHAGHRALADTDSQPVTCRTCHDLGSGKNAGRNLPANLTEKNGEPVLTARLTGKKYRVPQMRHPAHDRYGAEVECQVCHAQWSFNDSTTHLIRNDTDDYEPWWSLYVQSSSTVEDLLVHNLFSDEDELPPAMPDTVTGEMFPGVWYKGFTQRRWEDIIVRRADDGRIRVFRPILDLRLSYVDNDDNVIFDNLQGSDKVMLPYTPHTTGKAGLFYLNRFAHLLDKQQNGGRTASQQ